MGNCIGGAARGDVGAQAGQVLGGRHLLFHVLLSRRALHCEADESPRAESAAQDTRRIHPAHERGTRLMLLNTSLRLPYRLNPVQCMVTEFLGSGGLRMWNLGEGGGRQRPVHRQDQQPSSADRPVQSCADVLTRRNTSSVAKNSENTPFDPNSTYISSIAHLPGFLRHLLSSRTGTTTRQSAPRSFSAAVCTL